MDRSKKYTYLKRYVSSHSCVYMKYCYNVITAASSHLRNAVTVTTSLLLTSRICTVALTFYCLPVGSFMLFVSVLVLYLLRVEVCFISWNMSH